MSDQNGYKDPLVSSRSLGSAQESLPDGRQQDNLPIGGATKPPDQIILKTLPQAMFR